MNKEKYLNSNKTFTHRLPREKNHMTLFLFSLKLHDGIFPKKPDLTPKNT